MFKQLKVKPTIVCVFEQSFEMTMGRVSKRRVDPESGEIFHVDHIPEDREDIRGRLVQINEDKEDVLRMRYQNWMDTVTRIEDTYKNKLLIL